MNLSSLDDPLSGPIGSTAQIVASGMAEEYNKTNADLGKLIEKTSVQLSAVDLAISAPSHLDGDEDFEMMKRSWAFLGPGLWKKIEEAKVLTSNLSPSSKEKEMVCVLIAYIQTVLFIRRQTLEMNGLTVLRA